MRFRKTVDENLEPRGQSTKHGPHGLILRVEQIGRDGNICAQTEMETRGEALFNSLSQVSISQHKKCGSIHFTPHFIPIFPSVLLDSLILSPMINNILSYT